MLTVTDIPRPSPGCRDTVTVRMTGWSRNAASWPADPSEDARADAAAPSPLPITALRLWTLLLIELMALLALLRLLLCAWTRCCCW